MTQRKEPDLVEVLPPGEPRPPQPSIDPSPPNAGADEQPRLAAVPASADSASGAPSSSATGARARAPNDTADTSTDPGRAPVPARAGDPRAPGSPAGAAAGLDGAQGQAAAGIALGTIIADAQFFSKQASDNTRWLAAGGLAVVWALAQGKVTELRRWPMWLSVLVFAFVLVGDYLHYTRTSRKLADVIERCEAARTSINALVVLSRKDRVAPWCSS